MSYWYWSGGVAILGLALGAILFFIAYWRGKREGRRRARQVEVELLWVELLTACHAQHEAIDILFARLIQLDTTFRPSESGKPWEALQLGVAAMRNAERRIAEEVDDG